MCSTSTRCPHSSAAIESAAMVRSSTTHANLSSPSARSSNFHSTRYSTPLTHLQTQNITHTYKHRTSHKPSSASNAQPLIVNLCRCCCCCISLCSCSHSCCCRCLCRCSFLRVRVVHLSTPVSIASKMHLIYHDSHSSGGLVLPVSTPQCDTNLRCISISQHQSA